jgi:hypothetical protein
MDVVERGGLPVHFVHHVFLVHDVHLTAHAAINKPVMLPPGQRHWIRPSFFLDKKSST